MALPVSLADAQAQLRLPPGDLPAATAAEVQRFIADAAAWVENYTGHILEAREVTETVRARRCGADFTAWPIAPDAQMAVTYDDGTATPAALADARLDASRRPARLTPDLRRSWPFTSPTQLLTVTLRAGYEAPTDVPLNLRRAMLVMISAFDSDREGGEVFKAAEASARALCRNYRLRRL